jgi:hypothetical protein
MRNSPVSLQRLRAAQLFVALRARKIASRCVKLAVAAILHFTSHADHLQSAKLGNRKRAE